MAAPQASGGPSVRPLRAHRARARSGLCIVGCGRFAAFHARAARQLGGAARIAFASRDPARAEAYRRRFGGFAAFGSYEAAAADPRVDALVVCTPHHLHEAHARLAAEHGKSILLEKPIARTLAEADAILVGRARGGRRAHGGRERALRAGLRGGARLPPGGCDRGDPSDRRDRARLLAAGRVAEPAGGDGGRAADRRRHPLPAPAARLGGAGGGGRRPGAAEHVSRPSRARTPSSCSLRFRSGAVGDTGHLHRPRGACPARSGSG